MNTFRTIATTASLLCVLAHASQAQTPPDQTPKKPGATAYIAAPSVTSKYKILPGNSLLVEVIEDPSFNRTVLVGPDGRITLPLGGTFSVLNMTLEEISTKIADNLASSFALRPTVIASLQGVGATAVAGGTPIEIYVLGEVGQPGPLVISEGTTLLQALASVGGFSRFASVKRIQLRKATKNNQEQIFTFNYNDIVQNKTTAGLTILEAGDVILVPQRGLFEL